MLFLFREGWANQGPRSNVACHLFCNKVWNLSFVHYLSCFCATGTEMSSSYRDFWAISLKCLPSDFLPKKFVHPPIWECFRVFHQNILSHALTHGCLNLKLFGFLWRFRWKKKFQFVQVCKLGMKFNLTAIAYICAGCYVDIQCSPLTKLKLGSQTALVQILALLLCDLGQVT